MQNILKRISSFVLTITFFMTVTPVLANGSGTMTYTGDTVQLTPSSAGQTLFSVTGDTSTSGVISIRQCFTNGNPNYNGTNYCVAVNATAYGATQSTSTITADGNYSLAGSGNFFYLLQLVSTNEAPANNKAPSGSGSTGNPVTIATITTQPPVAPTTGNSFAEVPFVNADGGNTYTSGLNFGTPKGTCLNEPNNAYCQGGNMAYINGGVFGSNTIKAFRVVCQPFTPSDTSNYSFWGDFVASGGSSQVGTGITGGDISIFSVNQTGYTVLATLTIASYTASPYVNYVYKTLTTPIAVGANDQLTAYVSRSDALNANQIVWSNCMVSAGI